MALESITLNAAGMALIILGWLVQLIPMLKGRREMTLGFAALQMAGIILISVSMTSAEAGISVLNLISASCAAGVVVLIVARRPKAAGASPAKKKAGGAKRKK